MENQLDIQKTIQRIFCTIYSERTDTKTFCLRVKELLSQSQGWDDNIVRELFARSEILRCFTIRGEPNPARFPLSGLRLSETIEKARLLGRYLLTYDKTIN